MKKLLLLFFLLPLFASAQQTFWTPGVPPGSTSFSPTWRGKNTGVDSLGNLYIGNGNKWNQVLTAAQSTLNLDSIKFTGTGSAADPITLNFTKSPSANNNFAVFMNDLGYLVRPNINYSGSLNRVDFNGPKINAISGLMIFPSVQSGTSYFAKIDSASHNMVRDTNRYLPKYLSSDFRLYNMGHRLTLDSLLIGASRNVSIRNGTITINSATGESSGFSSHEHNYKNSIGDTLYSFRAGNVVDTVKGLPVLYEAVLRIKNDPVGGKDVVNLDYYNAHLPSAINLGNANLTANANRTYDYDTHTLTIGGTGKPSIVAGASSILTSDGANTFEQISHESINLTAGDGGFSNSSTISLTPSVIFLQAGLGGNGFFIEKDNPIMVYGPELRYVGIDPEEVKLNDLNIPDWGMVKDYADSVAASGSGVTSVTGTTNRITSTGGTTPAIDISASYVGQTSITTLGTIVAGSIPYSLITGTPTIPTGANPTASIGFTAVNGSSANFTRADGAPKADSTIIASAANHPTLAQLQTKVNNYLLISDTTSLARKTGNAAMQQSSYAAIGTGGNGFLSFLSQSVSPSRVSGVLKLYRDSVGSISYMNGLVRRTLKFTKNGDITTSFPYKLVSVLADSTDVAGVIAGLSSTYVPLTRTITFNGSTVDLSANRTFTVTTANTDTTSTGFIPKANTKTLVQLQTAFNLKLNISDTITMLNNMLHKSINETILGLKTAQFNNVGTTVTPGFVLANLQTLTTGQAQFSPSLKLSAPAFGTTLGTSQQVDWHIYSQGVAGTTPTSQIVFASAINGATPIGRVTISSNASLNASGTGAIMSNTRLSIAATTTTGMFSNNSTAATSGVPEQRAPAFEWSGHVWNTTATAADNVFGGRVDVRGTSAATPTAKMVWQIGTGVSTITYTDRMSLDNAGTLSLLAYTTKGMLANSSAGVLSSFADGTANQVLGMNSGATGYEYKTVTGSAMITIAHSANAITLTGNPAGLITGTPTIVAGTGAGTTPTISVTTNGKQLQVTVTTGTLPTGTNATIATVTLPNALTYTPNPVFSSASAATALLNGASMIYMTSTGSANVTITSGTTALTAATTYVWNIAL